MKKTVLLLLFFFIFSKCTVINPFRKSPYNTFVKNIKNKPYDVIIVPGVPYNDTTWSYVMKVRVYWSKFLFEKNYTKNIIYSGSAVYSPYIESKIMKLYGIALGIPTENIFTEEKAEHSTENIYYSYLLAKEKGFKKIALATDPFQTNNLRFFIRKHKLDIVDLPFLMDTLLIINKIEPKINVNEALVDSPATFVSLKKRESTFKRLRGTRGKNIDFSKTEAPK